MISKDDLTIVIQGRIHPIGIDTIPTYLQFGKVIVSSWSDDPNLNTLLTSEFLSQIRVVLNWRDPELLNHQRDGKYDNDGNIYLQCLSTLGGIRAADTDYVIKIRSDESFSDLTKLIEKLESGKVVMSNRFARKRGSPFHGGDTYFGGKTSLLLRSFLGLKGALEKKWFHRVPVMGAPKILSAEQKICISIIKTAEPHNALDEPVETMKRLFDICPISEMGEFQVNSSGWSRDGLPNPRNEFNPVQWNCISDINEI